MKIISFIRNSLALIALIMAVAAPMLAASPADAYYRRGAAGCGPRGCAAAGCGPRGCAAVGTRRGGPVYRRPAGVVVVNPRRYWRPGGAIAAGAAIGFIAGAAAVSVAGQPPRAGQCWYYTSPARTSGFWDVCPR
ncbi:hypothetical protein AB4Z52_03625 [Rhizobium sp. 2YAF20]|uniref:hypothetical protein n=1 Tax=Rhizobium sp. 2YAF20 TaxID=3233027 RepID=UPI003F9C2DB8